MSETAITPESRSQIAPTDLILVPNEPIIRSRSSQIRKIPLFVDCQVVASDDAATTRSGTNLTNNLTRADDRSSQGMNTLLVYMVNPQHIQQVNAFILANNGRDFRPTQVGGESKPDSFKHAFLQLWYWVGDQGFLRIVELGGQRQSFAFPSYKRSELFKSEGILEKLSSYGRKLEDL